MPRASRTVIEMAISYLDELAGHDVEYDQLREEEEQDRLAEQRQREREARAPEPPPYGGSDEDPEMQGIREVRERDARIWGGGKAAYKMEKAVTHPKVSMAPPEPSGRREVQQAFQGPAPRSYCQEMGIPSLEELDNPDHLTKEQLDESMHRTRLRCNAEYRKWWLSQHPEDRGLL